MDRCLPPEPPDLHHQLPRDMYYQIVHELRGSLPPPVTGTPEDLDRRDNAMIARVASLLPANADEVTLAAQCVAANAQALDCLRLARLYPNDLTAVLKCTAQAGSMMRQARGARAQLLKVQATRHKRESDSAATDTAAWTEHCAIGLMADALGRAPPAPPEPPPPPAAPEPERTDSFRQLSEAERYAALHPRRAALIRSLGGLPAMPDFDPPPPELVQAIVAGTSPMLLYLDTLVPA